MSKENPMNIKLYNYRIEFQSRGAAHVHGVLWVEFDKKFTIDLDNQLIKSAFQNFRNDCPLTSDEENEIIKYVDAFISCTSDPEEIKPLLRRECGNKDAIANRVATIAKEVNRHRHSKSCRKYGVSCIFHYPKLPSRKTLIT